ADRRVEEEDRQHTAGGDRRHQVRAGTGDLRGWRGFDRGGQRGREGQGPRGAGEPVAACLPSCGVRIEDERAKIGRCRPGQANGPRGARSVSAEPGPTRRAASKSTSASGLNLLGAYGSPLSRGRPPKL